MKHAKTENDMENFSLAPHRWNWYSFLGRSKRNLLAEMSWVKKDQRTVLQRFVENIVKRGEIPNHVAFILDGNRRYARGKNMSTMEGHRLGYGLVGDCMRWGLNFGIKEVTVYMFSIYNFSRTEYEVGYLMNLLKEIFNKVLEDLEYYERNGIRINVIGEWSLIPIDLKPVFSEVMEKTQHNRKITVNCAIAYTARNEISNAADQLLLSVNDQKMELENISETHIAKTLQNHQMRKVDLLIRPGVTRLSDFLLWQSSDDGVICFHEDMLWPSFNYWTLIRTLLYYQACKFELNLRKLEQSKDYQVGAGSLCTKKVFNPAAYGI